MKQRYRSFFPLPGSFLIIFPVAQTCSVGYLRFFICFFFGIGKTRELLDIPEDGFKKTVKINFMATWYLLKAVAKAMKLQKTGGSIVFLSSIIGAERGLYLGAAAYGFCLAGVQQLARVSHFLTLF